MESHGGFQEERKLIWLKIQAEGDEIQKLQKKERTGLGRTWEAGFIGLGVN